MGEIKRILAHPTSGDRWDKVQENQDSPLDAPSQNIPRIRTGIPTPVSCCLEVQQVWKVQAINVKFHGISSLQNHQIQDFHAIFQSKFSEGISQHLLLMVREPQGGEKVMKLLGKGIKTGKGRETLRETQRNPGKVSWGISGVRKI